MNRQISYSVNGSLSTIIYTFGEQEKLHAFSNGMLVNNKIEGLFTYSYEIQGEKQILRYIAQRGVKFSILKKGKMTRSVFLTLMKNMASVILRIEEYMLNAEQLLFDDEYIYADPQTLEVFFLFLPTDRKPDILQFHDFIRHSIFSGIFDTSENTSYLMELSNYINANPNIGTKALKKYLEELLSAVPAVLPAAAPAAVPAPTPTAPQPVPPKAKTENPPIGSDGAFGLKNQSAAENAVPDKTDKNAGFLGRIFGGKEKEPKKTEKPEKPKKPASSDAFFGMAIPGKDPAPKLAQGSEPNGAQIPPPPPPPIKAGRAMPPQPALKEKKTGAAVTYAVPEEEEAEAEESENTVILDASAASPSDVRYARLEGKKDSVTIDKPLFSVGKSKNSNFHIDYIIHNEHVGRYHASFERIGNVYYLSDNNSLNGTFVNGERLAPNTRRELKNGDLIKFANEEFTFKY